MRKLTDKLLILLLSSIMLISAFIQSGVTVYAEDTIDYDAVSTQIKDEVKKRVDDFNENQSNEDEKIYEHLQDGFVYRFKFYDATDANNIVEITEVSYSQNYLYNDTSLSQISDELIWYNPISIDGFEYDLDTTYSSGWGTGWTFDSFTDEYGSHPRRTWYIYYYQNNGDYTLKIDNDAYYRIYGMSGYENTFFIYTGISHFDDLVVWCIEPDIGTSSGVKYTGTESEGNILAAIATIYGYGYQGDTSTLAAIATQTVIWNSVGYGSIDDTITIKDKNDLVLEDESKIILEIRNRIKTAYEAYFSPEDLNLVIESGNAEFVDGKIKITDSSIQTIVLKTENKELLKLYNEGGSINYPEGITGEIDTDNGLITLTVNPKEYTDGNLKFSLIPDDYPENSQLYQAKSIKQKLMTFGIADKKQEIYSFDLSEVVFKIDISVEKYWNDHNNQDGMRSESVTIHLYADGEDTGKTIILSKDNNWTGTFSDLEEKKDGETITYTVVEEDIDEYKSEISGNQLTGFIVTNSHTPETIAVKGEKTWDDANNQDGVRQESITIRLYADGTEVEQKTVSVADGWKYEFTNLPKYNNGNEITYTITEDAVAEYTTTYNGYDITNSYTPGKTSVSVTKAWNDSNNQDGIRPNEVTVKLFADGVDTGKTLILNASNNWTGSFTELDEKKNGITIVYTVEEVSVDGYTAEITGNQTTSYTITNTHTPNEPTPPTPTTPDEPDKPKPTVPNTSVSPNTGDSTNVTFWFGTMFTSLIALFGMLFWRKKYAKN